MGLDLEGGRGERGYWREEDGPGLQGERASELGIELSGKQRLSLCDYTSGLSVDPGGEGTSFGFCFVRSALFLLFSFQILRCPSLTVGRVLSLREYLWLLGVYCR